jgi:NTE family protein
MYCDILRIFLSALAIFSLAFSPTDALAIDAQTTTEKEFTPTPLHRPKVALALGGGGTRGAAHVGVLRVFEKEKIPIDYIVGTSMGAIVGGLYDAGISIDQIEDKFRDRSLMKSYMTVPLWFRVAIAPVMLIPRLLGDEPYDGLYRGNHFRHYLLKSVPESQHQIQELKTPFQAIALNIGDGKTYAIGEGNLGYALQASSAIPTLRKPVHIGDKLFVDGGLAQNVPVTAAKNTGADIVIAVNVDEDFDQAPFAQFRKPGSVAARMISWTLWDRDRELCQQADLVIHPEVTGVALLSTKRKDALRAIKAGEDAAKEKIPEIRKCLQDWTAKHSPSMAPLSQPETNQTADARADKGQH